MNNMEKLGIMFNSDKVTHHKYHEIYPLYLNKLTNLDGGMIEIGVETLASVKMWVNMFQNMMIYGVDINIDNEGYHYKIFKGDQSNETDLDNFKKIITKPIYFINDDGSHIPEHQLLTFNKLFPVLEDGGIYIIEDVETSYWSKNGLYGYRTNYGYKHKDSIVEVFKNIIDCVNSEFLLQGIDTPVQHLDNIKSLTFAYNCIIIEKGTRNKRPYRFSYNL